MAGVVRFHLEYLVRDPSPSVLFVSRERGVTGEGSHCGDRSQDQRELRRTTIVTISERPGEEYSLTGTHRAAVQRKGSPDLPGQRRCRRVRCDSTPR